MALLCNLPGIAHPPVLGALPCVLSVVCEYFSKWTPMLVIN